MTAEPFPVIRMAEVRQDLGRPAWLVEPLWAAGGAGVLGGHPKSGKTWLALEMAVSVASGSPCLGAYPVHDAGPVLLYLAEDSASSAHERVQGICRHRGLCLENLDLLLLRTPVLRLDSRVDAERLAATVAAVRPKLLVLDPFVRVHSADENSASEISRLLATLTALKRAFEVAVLLVHHVRKNGAAHPGQALRGSGDLRAWGDSNLFLRDRAGSLELSGEHRAAPPLDAVGLELVTNGDGTTHLELAGLAEQTAPVSLDADVVEALGQAASPMTRTALRSRLRVNNQRLGDALARLEEAGALLRDRDGWRLSSAFCSPPLGKERNGTALPNPGQTHDPHGGRHQLPDTPR